jgi:mono/diheme cytochrome c family protein
MKKTKIANARKAIVSAIIVLFVGAMACGSQQPQGEQLFTYNCARCHGDAADGTDLGPPLVHMLYEPGHHPDFSFQNAVKNGVISHHWDFGDMPPVAGLSEDEITQIIAYVRDLQRERGIIK